MTTRTRDNTRRIRSFPDHVPYSTTLETEPTSFTQANFKPEWRHAMSLEINALATNNTWTLIPPRPNQQPVGCKWVYRIKHCADGSIERYKARLVAKGFHQIESINYFDTFSPVVRPTTIHIILSITVSSHWPIRQLDVHNAFLNGDLTEQVLMTQPPGFIDPDHPDYVCLLSKALYELKQSSRAWFTKLSSVFLTIGFAASNYDPSLFISHSHDHTTMLLIYVNDILITRSNPSHVNQCISHLHNAFSLKYFRPIRYFLDIEVRQITLGVHLNQTKYLYDLLTRTNMHTIKPSPTPMTPNATLSHEDSPPFDNPHLYRSIVGALQYSTITRSDLSFVINKVSQFMHSPTTNH
jgi:Reverse transcriptase (RNA-dependent DNA polymerase)